MAMWVIAVVAVALCQCFSPGGNDTTSPGRISSTGPPSRCAQPHPLVTIRVWPSGWVCHAVRAPGSKVTLAPPTRPGSGASKSVSTLTIPVNQSAGPLAEGWVPHCLISIALLLRADSRRAEGVVRYEGSRSGGVRVGQSRTVQSHNGKVSRDGGDEQRDESPPHV